MTALQIAGTVTRRLERVEPHACGYTRRPKNVRQQLSIDAIHIRGGTFSVRFRAGRRSPSLIARPQPFLRRALPVHHLRRELAGLGEVDEVVRPWPLRRQLLQVGEQRLDARELDALEERRRRLAGLLLAFVVVDQALDSLGNAPRRNLRGRACRSSPPGRSCRRPPSRSTAAPPCRRCGARCPGSRWSRCGAGRSRSGSR